MFPLSSTVSTYPLLYLPVLEDLFVYFVARHTYVATFCKFPSSSSLSWFIYSFGLPFIFFFWWGRAFFQLFVVTYSCLYIFFVQTSCRRLVLKPLNLTLFHYISLYATVSYPLFNCMLRLKSVLLSYTGSLPYYLFHLTKRCTWVLGLLIPICIPWDSFIFMTHFYSYTGLSLFFFQLVVRRMLSFLLII